MSPFGRRQRREQELAGASGPEPTVEAAAAEPIVRAQGTYRVAVSAAGDAPAHWGPAYNAGFAETIAHVMGFGTGEVDLLKEAKAGADRCRVEHGEGHEVWVERLVTRDGEAEWERVA